MAWKVTFEIYGETYSPQKVNFKFTEENEPNDIATTGRNKGLKYGYGSSTYLVPKQIERAKIFSHLAKIFVPILKELKDAGAENLHIDIARIYHLQCNEELGIEEISEIAKLNCAISYSAYSGSQEDEMKGFD